MVVALLARVEDDVVVRALEDREHDRHDQDHEHDGDEELDDEPTDELALVRPGGRVGELDRDRAHLLDLARDRGGVLGGRAGRGGVGERRRPSEPDRQ